MKDTIIEKVELSKEGFEALKRLLVFTPKAQIRNGRKIIGFGHVLKEGEFANKDISLSEATDLLTQDLKVVCNFFNKWVVYKKSTMSQSTIDSIMILIYLIGLKRFKKSFLFEHLRVCSKLYCETTMIVSSIDEKHPILYDYLTNCEKRIAIDPFLAAFIEFTIDETISRRNMKLLYTLFKTPKNVS